MAKKVLVIGDTILDETINASAVGLSLESPTLKVSHESTSIDLGGAGNVAKNLVNLGCDVTFLTSGDIELQGARVICLSGKPHKKTRVWVRHGDSKYKYLQINHNEITRSETDFDIVSLIDSNYDALVISDYRKGTLSPSLIQSLIKHKNFSEVISMSQISDKEYDYSVFSGSSFLILNEHEHEKSPVKNTPCVVTQGERGSTYIFGKEKIVQAGYDVNTIDTTGAGDCFVAAFCASDGDIKYRMKQANEYAAKSTTMNGTKLYEGD